MRSLLTVVAERSLIVKHVHIKTAYWYDAAPGNETGNTAGVSRLKRSMYGLKQSARVWNRTIDGVFKRAGFVHSSAYMCLYVRTRNGQQAFILINVDDILVACSREVEFVEIFQNASS